MAGLGLDVLEIPRNQAPLRCLDNYVMKDNDPWIWIPDAPACKYRRITLTLLPCKRLKPSWFCEILEFKCDSKRCKSCTVEPKV